MDSKVGFRISPLSFQDLILNSPTVSPGGDRTTLTLRTILIAGLIAGTIDIGAASVINWIDPLIILRFVAGGLLGKSALQGGLTVIALGILLQWCMSLIISGIYMFIALRLPKLTERPITAGVLYGVVIFFVMNYVVVPLSAWHRWPHFATVKFIENLAAMVLFGLIVAFVTHGAFAVAVTFGIRQRVEVR